MNFLNTVPPLTFDESRNMHKFSCKKFEGPFLEGCDGSVGIPEGTDARGSCPDHTGWCLSILFSWPGRKAATPAASCRCPPPTLLCQCVLAVTLTISGAGPWARGNQSPRLGWLKVPEI